MLSFCNTNLFYTFELSNDFADEVWTTEFPACVNEFDGESIYEGVKVNLFKYKDLINNPSFILDKADVMLTIDEMMDFVFTWYDTCVKRKLISNCITKSEWMLDYINCYKNTYEKSNTYEGALGYYESLALYKINFWCTDLGVKIPDLITLDNIEGIIPEISWMLEDYIVNNKSSIWEDYLTEYIRNNIRRINYKKALLERINNFIKLDINLNPNLTIADVDLMNPQALFYFDNPFYDDFHTNYIYIDKLLSKLRN